MFSDIVICPFCLAAPAAGSALLLLLCCCWVPTVLIVAADRTSLLIGTSYVSYCCFRVLDTHC